MAYVERLVECCEVSVNELRSLEQRLTAQQGELLTGLAECVRLLTRSQSELTQSFVFELTESASYAQLEGRLTKSAQLLTAAEARLSKC